MQRGATRQLLPLAFAVLLLAGGGALAVLQIGWVNAASSAEEERAMGNLSIGASRVRNEAEDELRILVSLMRVSRQELELQDWSEVTAATALWYETAPFPLLLRSAYVIPAWPPSTALLYSRDSGTYAPAELPEEVAAGVAAAFEGEGAGFRLPSMRALADGTTLFVAPAYAEPEPGNPLADLADTGPRGAVAVAIDTRLAFTEAIPALMADNLAGYPFRVVDRTSDEIIYSSSAVERGRKPEMVVSLDSLLFTWSRFGPSEGPEAATWESHARGAEAADSPSVRFWLERARAGRGRDAQNETEPLENARMVMEVYYPNRPLESVIQGRRTIGIVAGIGILSALVASAGVLFSLYRKTALLRAGEQEFVASMSHELRTPISVIQAMSDNLAEGVVTDPARLPRYARVIHDQTKRLADMVESILFYSGLQANASKAPTLAKVELKLLLQDVHHTLGDLAAGRGFTLRMTAESVPDTVCSDATALRLVLENLVTNAIRHADPGEIRLLVVRRAFDMLRISVEDDGPGIPQKEQNRVFEPFVRGERSIKEQKPGSGLGLHLVKRVCGMLGGSVTLESPYATLAEVTRPGCRFTVVLPCKERCPDAE